MPAQTAAEKVLFGRIMIFDKGNSALPLEKTNVTAQMIGPISSVNITQYFGNPFEDSLELEYLFPLPHKAALIDFELKIGARNIKGELLEIENARKIYEDALEMGQHASLLEERRPNLFAVRIANVSPGEKIQVTLLYQEPLSFKNGEYEFVFPMGLTPKYHSPFQPAEGAGTDAPIASAGEAIGPVEISLSIDAGCAYGEPTSITHPIEVIRLDEQRFNVRLSSPAIPDHDFILRYKITSPEGDLAIWRSPDVDGDYLFAMLYPPPLADKMPEPPAREFIFVLDRSGSMMGEAIAQARNALRACLRTLNPQDQFRILLFDDVLEWFQLEPSPVTQASVDQADQYLEQVEGRGGTEIVQALDAALSFPSDPDHTRYVVFLTDGAVSSEDRALQQVKRKLGTTRLFTFGIGPAVNRALLQRLAQSGRGASEFLQLDEDIESAILRFQDQVSFPLLTNLQLHWQRGKTWDTYPATLPDLYTGEPLQITSRIKDSGKTPATLRLTGERGQEYIDITITLSHLPQADPMIKRIWARARLDDLIGMSDPDNITPKIRDQVISLSFEHHLATAFTAFVAVDSIAQPRSKKSATIQITQPLPQGLNLQGFSTIMPMLAPAMPAPSGAVMHKMAAMARPVRSRAKSGETGAAALYESAALQAPTPSMLPGSAPLQSGSAQPANSSRLNLDPEETFKWLARTQKLDGSWNDDVELTAAGLLALVRHGHTTQVGHYRQQIRRAYLWLAQATATGFSAFARALAIHELASATALSEHQLTADKMVLSLPQPSAHLEEVAWAVLQSRASQLAVDPTATNLDELRASALLRLPAQASQVNWPTEHIDLVRAWSAAL